MALSLGFSVIDTPAKVSTSRAGRPIFTILTEACTSYVPSAVELYCVYPKWAITQSTEEHVAYP